MNMAVPRLGAAHERETSTAFCRNESHCWGWGLSDTEISDITTIIKRIFWSRLTCSKHDEKWMQINQWARRAPHLCYLPIKDLFFFSALLTSYPGMAFCSNQLTSLISTWDQRMLIQRTAAYCTISALSKIGLRLAHTVSFLHFYASHI